MCRRALLVACVVGVAVLACGRTHAASDYDFGMALMTKFGFDEEAEKFFSGLQQGTNRAEQLTGSFGLGGIKKLRADRTDDPAKAARLYVDAKKLISEFLRDSANSHPDRGAANAALIDIEKRYLRQLRIQIKDQAAATEVREKALREAKEIFTRLLGPLREDKTRAFSALKAHFPWPERPPRAAIKAYVAAEGAMARYYGMVLQQAELFPRSSAEGKRVAKNAVKEMETDSGFCDEGELAGFVLRFNYELGRAHVAAGDLKKASESFGLVLEQETYGLPPASRQFVELHQLFAFYKKAQAYFDAEKWDETIKIVDDMFGTLPQALNEPQGNGALLCKAEALFRKDPPDYAGALREATKVVEKDLGFWADNASRLMAEVLEAMKKDAQGLAFAPGILHRVAVGEVQRAYAEADLSKRARHFETAIGWLQKTISATRAEGVKFETRIEHGPTAWFQLGIIYSKMGLWYEARFSFEAVLRYYAKDVVGRTLADRPTYAERITQIKKDIKSGKIQPKEEGDDVNPYAYLFDEAAQKRGLKKILGGLEAQLKKSANNLMVSARRRHNESRSDFDQKRLDEALIILIHVDPSKRKDIDFHRALLARAEAEGHLKRKEIAKAVDRYEAACELLLGAAKARQSRRELAYHLAGMAYYQVMSQLGKPEIQKTLPALAKRASEFGEKALKAFAAFMVEAAKHTDPVPAEKKKRDGRIATIDVARPVIHMALGRFKEAVAAADEFLARDVKAAEYVPTVMWTRVRALREIAIAALGTPAEAEALGKVIQAAEAVQADAPQFETAAKSLKAAVFNAAATKLSELAEKAEGTEKAALLARVDEYSRKNADYTRELIEGQVVTLPFLLSLATQFYQQKAYVGARDLYVDRILKDYDPNGTGEKMVIAEDAFEAAAKSARLGDFKNETALKKARERIKALKELVFGEPIKERRDRRWKGVIHPSKKMNWSKAYREIVAILTEAPRLTSKPELEKIRDELIFRIQMMTVKLNLADCDMALARKLAESKPEEARKLFEEAAGHVKKVREYYWRDNELRFVEAEAYENIGKRQEAQDLFNEAVRRAPEDSPNYHRAQIGFSKVTLRMAEAEKDPKAAVKLFRKAGNYAYAMIKTSEAEDTWKSLWPEAKDFLAKCDAGIIARNEKVIDTAKLDKLEDVEGYTREVSANDQKLHVQIKIVKERIRNGEADPDKEDEALKEAFEVHLAGLPDKALDTITGQLLQGSLKKARGDIERRTFFVRFLYQSPFKDFVLRKDAIRLGVLVKENDPIPVALFSERALKAARDMGYVTKDGKLVPRGELPESDRELLRKELDAVEEEAPEDGAVPAPAPEEGAVGTDAAAPAEEVAP